MAFVSPSLPYAAHPAYAKPSKFKGVDARAVLKFKVHPDSHPLIPDEDGGTGPSTVHETPADPVIPEDQMEWYTARHSAHLLTGIFIKVDCTKKMLRQTKQAIERELAAPALGPAGARWEWLKNLGDRETGWEPYADDVNARLSKRGKTMKTALRRRQAIGSTSMRRYRSTPRSLPVAALCDVLALSAKRRNSAFSAT